MFTLSRLTEAGFGIVTLLLFSGALLPMLTTSEGSPITEAIWLGIYLVTLVLVLVRLKRFLYVLTTNKLVLLLAGLVGIALISTIWSAAPGDTLREGVALAGTTLFGVYFATRYSLREQLRLLAWALGIAAFLSLLFALMLPSYGISYNPSTLGDWKGVYGHKQPLGTSMTLGAITFFILAANSYKYRWLMLACCGLSLYVLFFSNSITGLVFVAIFPVLWVLYKALRRVHGVAVPLLVITLLLCSTGAILLLRDVETTLGTLGRDTTISGRTELWPTVLDMIWERPWLGYGYNGFWQGWEGYSAQVWLATGQPYTGAHNSILDIWLGLGLLGVSVFALSLLGSFLRAITWARYTKVAEGLWPLVFLTFFSLKCVFESIAMGANTLSWVLYVAVALAPITQFGREDRIVGHNNYGNWRSTEQIRRKHSKTLHSD